MIRKLLKKYGKRIAPFGFVGFGAIAIYAAILFSMITIILLIAELSLPSEDTGESSGSTEAPTYNGVFFNQLHEQLFQLDMSKIPNDAPLNIAQDMYTASGWTLKDYLNAYMLACEICARPEINEDLTQPDIYPEDLLGSWFMEATLKQGASVFTDAPYSYCRYIDVVSASGTFYGPFQQNKAWSQVGTPDNTYHMSIYISWQENPDLQPNERAYFGTPSMLAEGRGYVMTKDSYAMLRDQGVSALRQNYPNSSEFISSAIRWGTLATGNDIDTRPNSKYLPDAMYTNALHMRLALDGRNPVGNKTSTNAYGNAEISALLSGLDHKSAMGPRKALAKDINSANYLYLEAASTFDACGEATQVYVAAALNPDVTFYYVDKVPKDKVKRYMSGGGMLYQLIYGEGNIATTSNTVESATDGMLYLLETSGEYRVTRQGVQSARESYASQHGSAIYQQFLYGFTNSQAGHVIIQTMEEIAKNAVTHEEWKYDEPQTAPGEDGGSGGSTGTPGGPPVDTSVCTGASNCACHINGQFWGEGGWPSEYHIATPTDIPGQFSLGNLNMPYLLLLNTQYANSYTTYSGHRWNMDFTRNMTVGPNNVQQDVAIADGVIVTIVANDKDNNYGSGIASWGNTVVIAHPGGYFSLYGHLDTFAHIYPGMYVTKGTPLGVMGTTGNSTGVHVHLEISIGNKLINGCVYTDSRGDSGGTPIAPGVAYPGIIPRSPASFSQILSQGNMYWY